MSLDHMLGSMPGIGSKRWPVDGLRESAKLDLLPSTDCRCAIVLLVPSLLQACLEYEASMATSIDDL